MTARTYSQACSIATFLDHLGARWSLLIVRDLLIGPRRFKQMLDSLKGIGPNLLTQRLGELQDLGIVKKIAVAEEGPTGAYALTRSGQALEPILLAIARWSLTNLEPMQEPRNNLDEWLVVAFKACFKPPEGNSTTEQYEFRIGDAIFSMEIKGEDVETRLGHAEKPVFTFVSNSANFGRLISGEIELTEAESAELIFVQGDRAAYERWLSMYVL